MSAVAWSPSGDIVSVDLARAPSGPNWDLICDEENLDAAAAAPATENPEEEVAEAEKKEAEVEDYVPPVLEAEEDWEAEEDADKKIAKRLDYFVKLSKDRAAWGLSHFEAFLKTTGKWSQYQFYQNQKKLSGGKVPESYKKPSKRKPEAQATPSLIVTLKYRKTSDQSGARAPLGERDSNAQIFPTAPSPPPLNHQPATSSTPTRNNPHH